jgi:putative restriction endonuclease
VPDCLCRRCVERLDGHHPLDHKGSAMRLFIGITDGDWHRFLSRRADLDEVNFWQPSGSTTFRALQPGEPFLFKLHAPHQYIVGGGMYAGFAKLLVDQAWDAFGAGNGAASLEQMRARVAKYRRVPPDPRENYLIGCIILRLPFWLPEAHWIPVPAEFPRNVQRGMGFEATSGAGQALWQEVERRLGKLALLDHAVRTVEGAMWSEPRLVRQRLGQGSFKALITETYERRCAITREKALPVLQAAHIRPVTRDGAHRIDNGLLLRSDVHTLFDRGYITVTPAREIRISRRLKHDFDNGEHYYQLDGSRIWTPSRTEDQPNREFLEWHADTVFRG